MAAALEKSLLSVVPDLAQSDARNCASILGQKSAKEVEVPSESVEELLRCVCESTTSQLQKLWKEEDAVLEMQKTSQTRREGAQANVESVKKTVEFAFQGGKEIPLAKLKVLKQAHQYAVGGSANVLQSVLKPVEQKLRSMVTVLQSIATEMKTLCEELSKINACVAGKKVSDAHVVSLMDQVVKSLQALQSTVSSCLTERQGVLNEVQRNSKSADQAQRAFVEDKAVKQFLTQIDNALNAGSDPVDATNLLQNSPMLSVGVGKVVAYVDANEQHIPKLAQRMMENRQTLRRGMAELQKVQFLIGSEGINVGSHVTGGSPATAKSTGGKAPDLENDEFSQLEAECLVQSENFHGFAKKLHGPK